MEGPLPPRPLVSFSPGRWEADGAKEEDLSGDGDEEDDDEEELRRTGDAESARFRQGIFSKLTTGNDTLWERADAALKYRARSWLGGRRSCM